MLNTQQTKLSCVKKEKHKRSRFKKKQGKPVDTERQISKKSIDKTPTLIHEALQLVDKIETSTSVEIITLENQKVLRDDEKEPKFVDSTNVIKTQTIEKLIDDILSPTDEISEPVANEPLTTIEVVQLENEEEPIIINQKIDGDSNLVQNQSLQTPQKEKRKRSCSRKKGSKTIQPSNLIETRTLTVVKMQEQPDIPTPAGETPPSIEVVNLENEEAIIITGKEIIEKDSGASISIVKDQSLQMPKKESQTRSRTRKKESKLVESSETMETQILTPTDKTLPSIEIVKLENEEVLIISDTETSEAKIDKDSSATTTIVQNQLLQTTKNEKPKRSRSKKKNINLVDKIETSTSVEIITLENQKVLRDDEKEPKFVDSTNVIKTQTIEKLIDDILSPTDEISTEMIKLENEEVLIITDTETSEAVISMSGFNTWLVPFGLSDLDTSSPPIPPKKLSSSSSQSSEAGGAYRVPDVPPPVIGR
ncbi:hypothetical protein FQA39_LY03484 [Lamprigera yunnana]|nr:hypothetical protein FQA39_LY03484 [Lamprigera yunnana]